MDSSTIIAALVHGLTGSTFAIGAAAVILHYGWLFPQLFVAYFAQRRRRRMPIYMLGAFGRATCLAALAGLLHLDWTEGVPGPRYSHLWVNAQDIDDNALRAITYVAEGKERDGNPSLRYITLIRDGARAHGLPDHYLRYLDSVEHAK